MSNTDLYTPRKRQDLTEWLDKINALKNAINFKLELDKQITLQDRLINALKRKNILSMLLMLIAPARQRIKSLKVQIEISKLRTSNENNEKQKLVYHKNELLLEDDMEEIYEELDLRYEAYLTKLMSYYEKVKFGTPKGSELPDKDIKILVTKFQTEPPASKTDRLSFYLTMEELLYRCSKA